MGAHAGRFARVYSAIASGGVAVPIPFISAWTIDSESERYDVTSQGDTSKSYVQGLPDAKGTWKGFHDNATAQLYTASQDGISRPTYFYPDLQNTPTKYWYGRVFWSFSAEFDVAGAGSVSGTWAVESPGLSSNGI